MSLLDYEWTKARTLRSTWTLSIATVLVTVSVSIIGISGALDGNPEALAGRWDPTGRSLEGIAVGQLLIGTLGAHMITNEYATRTLQSSLSLVPRRSKLLAMKACITVFIAFGVSLASVTVSFLVGQMMIATSMLPCAMISDPEVIRALSCAVAYLTLTALLGLAFGVFTRSSAGALAVLVTVSLLAPSLSHALPAGAGQTFAAYWPISAGQSAYRIANITTIPPLISIGIMGLCTIYATVASHLVFRSRDVE